MRHIKETWLYPDGLLKQAFNSVRALNLDFGTVDLGCTFNDKGQLLKTYTYEVNTGGYLNKLRAKIFAQIFIQKAKELGVL